MGRRRRGIWRFWGEFFVGVLCDGMETDGGVVCFVWRVWHVGSRSSGLRAYSRCCELAIRPWLSPSALVHAVQFRRDAASSGCALASQSPSIPPCSSSLCSGYPHVLTPLRCIHLPYPSSLPSFLCISDLAFQPLISRSLSCICYFALVNDLLCDSKLRSSFYISSLRLLLLWFGSVRFDSRFWFICFLFLVSSRFAL